MKKVLFASLILVLSNFQSVLAEKIPVRIAPTQIISSHEDEIEVADWISFEIVNDIYVNDKLYIKKETPIYGFVDFFKPNGWVGDSAEIYFKNFETKDVDGKKITLNYPLKINGNNLKANDVKQLLSWKLPSLLSSYFILIRGSEIFIEPDTRTFNLFITL